MSTAGRPSSYRPEYCQLAHNYCLLGATNARLGEFFGVTSRTIDNWISSIPEFREEVQRGRNMADALVAESLYQRAVGYSHMVERVVGPPGQEQVITYKKSYPPHTAACKHWLRNRRPQNWGGRVRPARRAAVEANAFSVPQAANGNAPPPAPSVEQNDSVDRRPVAEPASVSQPLPVVPTGGAGDADATSPQAMPRPSPSNGSPEEGASPLNSANPPKNSPKGDARRWPFAAPPGKLCGEKLQWKPLVMRGITLSTRCSKNSLRPGVRYRSPESRADPPVSADLLVETLRETQEYAS